MLGELDCREELLQGVRQVKYTNLPDAVDYVAQKYVQVMQRACLYVHDLNPQALVIMAGVKGLRLIVHPVPPVQDACRLVVRHLNAALQRYVAAAAPVRGCIVWLNCEAAMLEPKPAALGPVCGAVTTQVAQMIVVQVTELNDVYGGTEDPSKLLMGGAKFRQALSFDGVHMAPALYTRDVLGVALRVLKLPR